MKLKIDKESCFKKDLKIPKGYRLIEMWEILREAKTNKKLKQLLIDNYVWCILNNNSVGAVGFGDGGGWFRVDGNSLFGYYGGRSRGVFVKIGDLI